MLGFIRSGDVLILDALAMYLLSLVLILKRAQDGWRFMGIF